MKERKSTTTRRATAGRFAARSLSLGFLASCLSMVGCSGGGDDDGPTDKREMEPPDVCASNDDCTDGVFCNGEERCNPDHEDAAPSGCLPAADEPCSSDSSCDESADACGCEVPDSDGDGHKSVMCAGDDCDDDDASRFPGNTEVCDAEHHDEDCDASTFGFRDQDSDEDPDAECCNEDESGDLTCGTDCNDVSGIQHSFNTEVCDEVDNDCDGLTDEAIDGTTDDGLKAVFTIDFDGDSFGSDADDAETVFACGAPEGYVSSKTDCDDDESEVHPAAVDSCNDDVDNDCSETVNDPPGGCACEGNESESCGLSQLEGGLGLLGMCATFNRQCNDGTWDDCPLLPTNAGPELCDADNLDENCDGIVNGASVANDLKVPYYRDRDGDGYPHLATSATYCPNLNPGGWITDANPNDCVDVLLTSNPLSDDINPGKVEICNGYDDNCNNIVDGLTSNGDLELTFYHDDDGDDQGGTDTTTAACTDPGADWYATAQDCNDNDATIYLGGQESCDGVDEDCDGLADADDAQATNNCDVTGQIESAVCAVNQCLVDECSGAYLDCDTSYDCETNGASDYDNCGECGTSCYQQCRASTCDEFVQVEGGSSHTCARTESGLVRCWGLNDVGQLGDTTGSQRTSPTATSVVNAALDLSTSTNTSCALSSSTLWCWGEHTYGELGTSNPAPGSGVFSTIPLPVAGITSPRDISVGGDHACVVHNSGAIACWGRNHRGQLGNGQASVGITLPGGALAVGGSGALSNAIAVSAGLRHTCAIIGASANSTSGQVVCWGEDVRSQLGDGATSHGSDATACSGSDCSLTPVQVLGPVANPQPLSDAVAISAGWYHTCAIRLSGQVVCWGYNSRGQLGDGSLTNRATWVATTGATNATQIEANNEQTCAVNGGAVTCWGDNSNAQLGDGQTYNCDGAGLNCSSAPIALGSPMNNATAVGSGANHTCAISNVGRAYCWGLASSGRLGNGTTTAHPTPYPVIREP